MTILLICINGVLGIFCLLAIFIQSQDKKNKKLKDLIETDVNIKKVDFPCQHVWKRIAKSRNTHNNDILLTFICIHCDEIKTIIKN